MVRLVVAVVVSVVAMLVSQVGPVQPAAQLHVKLSTPSVQVPEFAHWLGEQLSMLVSQLTPS